MFPFHHHLNVNVNVTYPYGIDRDCPKPQITFLPEPFAFP
jgi:hypothetical protein